VDSGASLNTAIAGRRARPQEHEVPHGLRRFALSLAAAAELVLLALPAFGVFDAIVAVEIAAALGALLVGAGLVDATLVERRRRDPSVSALWDDVLE
jgi:hypothetical protein